MAKKASADKPSKPYADYPLFPHAAGVWAKKIRGKLHYFGPWRDPDAALQKYLNQKDDLMAGRTPRPESGVTVWDLCNHFMAYKDTMTASGELAPRTFKRYHAACHLLITTLGERSCVESLVADDFTNLRAIMAKRWGPVAVGNEIQMVRSVFKHGYDAGLYDKPVRFGPGFKKPSAKTLRLNRARNGPRMFTPKEIKAALDRTTPNMKAMILLGVNGAMGNTDLGEMPKEAVDLKTCWLDYPRPKTGVHRRIPLWTETVAAIQQALDVRSPLKNREDASLLFIGPRGQNYIGNHKGYRVTAEWDRTARKAGVEGRTFYDLRRTFQTVAEGARDLVAVQAIMGHAPASGDMAAVYRQRVDDARLKAVTDYIHRWLFGKTA